MTDKEKLTSYGNRLQKLKAKYDAGNLSLSDKLAMKNELDAIKKGYEKDFGLPSSAKSNYGFDIDAAINQATSIGTDIQTRIKKTDTATKAPTDPLATSKKETTAAKPVAPTETKSLKRKKIENGYVYRSDDGGKTYIKGEKATADQIKEYDTHKAKKQSEPASATAPAKSTSKPTTAKAGDTYDTDEETKRVQTAATNPEGYVTQEQYDELERLYKAADKSSGGNPNKKTPETLAFQKYYHSIPALKEVAKQIISNEKAITTKGKTLPVGERYDITANEDSMFGPRTKKYWQAVKKEEGKPAEDKDITLADEEDQEAEKEAIKRNPPMAKRTGQFAPWYLQDIIKTAGAAADLGRIKRYLPWQATPQVFLPEATFYDPTRELAANTEQANLAMQAQQAFTNPQQLAAASSVIQGQALKNAADVMGRYNNLNVGLSNQLNQQRTEIMNTASANKANLDTQLWDKYTVANQQFDNSKAMARQNLRQSFMDAITNRAKAQALNTIYPNYYTDPSRGGMVDFNPDYGPFVPTTSSNDDVASKVKKLMTDIPGLTPDRALDYFKSNKNADTDDTDNQGESYLRAAGIMS
jgi:hypothetical protein